MNKRWRNVALEEAQPGMELAADLRERGGAVLLPAGASLTEASLRALGRRGIEVLAVVDERAPAPLDEAVRARVEARLAHLFRKCGGRACGALRREVEAFRLEHEQERAQERAT